jgi:hypothetical protein
MARPKKPESEVFENLTSRVAPAHAREISSLAATYDRSMSWVARKLLLRGLAAFRRDGSFDEDEANINSRSGACAPPADQIGEEHGIS